MTQMKITITIISLVVFIVFGYRYVSNIKKENHQVESVSRVVAAPGGTGGDGIRIVGVGGGGMGGREETRVYNNDGTYSIKYKDYNSILIENDINDTDKSSDKYNNLIKDLKELLVEAENFEFHDFKNEKYATPKIELVKKLEAIIIKVKEGEYE